MLDVVGQVILKIPGNPWFITINEKKQGQRFYTDDGDTEDILIDLCCTELRIKCTLIVRITNNSGGRLSILSSDLLKVMLFTH
jgi:hypothetical protein